MSATKWILLEPGDTLRQGDQVWSDWYGGWVPLTEFGRRVTSNENPYRRMDKDATAAAEYDEETKQYRKGKL